MVLENKTYSRFRALSDYEDLDFVHELCSLLVDYYWLGVGNTMFCAFIREHFSQYVSMRFEIARCLRNPSEPALIFLEVSKGDYSYDTELKARDARVLLGAISSVTVEGEVGSNHITRLEVYIDMTRALCGMLYVDINRTLDAWYDDETDPSIPRMNPDNAWTFRNIAIEPAAGKSSAFMRILGAAHTKAPVRLHDPMYYWRIDGSSLLFSSEKTYEWDIHVFNSKGDIPLTITRS